MTTKKHSGAKRARATFGADAAHPSMAVDARPQAGDGLVDYGRIPEQFRKPARPPAKKDDPR